MSRPRAIVFDLGKVLVEFDYGRAAANLAPHSKMSAEEIRRLIDQTPLLYRYETGLMTTAEFVAELRAATGFTGTSEEFASLFGDIFTAINPMIGLHADLRTAGLPTYIFSNTNEMAVRHIRATFPFFANFTDYILSYEHGAMKPHAKLYEVVERLTGGSGKELVYIDDRPENIEAGKQRGWHAILHTSHPETHAALQKLL